MAAEDPVEDAVEEVVEDAEMMLEEVDVEEVVGELEMCWLFIAVKFLLFVEELMLLVTEEELLLLKLDGSQSSSVGISIIERVDVSESLAIGAAMTLSAESESLDSD